MHASKETLNISSPVPPASVDQLLDTVLGCLDDHKAEDVTSIDLSGKSAIADYMVIANGRSQRQVASIAEHLLTRLKDQGFGNARVEGLPQADWVLIDAGDVVVHIFRPEVRSFYNLDKMWSVDLSVEAAVN